MTETPITLSAAGGVVTNTGSMIAGVDGVELGRSGSAVYNEPLAVISAGKYGVVGGTATRCPNVKFIFSHAGGTLTSVATRFLGNLDPETLARPVEPNSRLYHVKRFYYDTAGAANAIQLQALKMLVGPSQIVYGTDFPFVNAPTTSAGVDLSGFTAEELRAINRDNAIRLVPRLA